MSDIVAAIKYSTETWTSGGWQSKANPDKRVLYQASFRGPCSRIMAFFSSNGYSAIYYLTPLKYQIDGLVRVRGTANLGS